MQKPNNYENTVVSGEYTPIELGGHTAVIKRLEEATSRTGKPMIKVAIDFDAQDSQPNYFSKQYEADTRDPKTWPYQAVQYILTEDADGNCNKSFKTFISCVEKSNNSECVWGDGFAQWFKGKKVGVVFGEVEEEYNGEVKPRRKIRYVCQYDKAKSAAVPEKKFLNEPVKNNQTESDNNLGKWMNIPEGAEEQIPF